MTRFDAMNHKIRRIAQVHQAGKYGNRNALLLVELADFIFGEYLGAPAGAWSPGIDAGQGIRFFAGAVSDTINMEIGLVVAGIDLELSIGIGTSFRQPGTALFIGDEAVCPLELHGPEARCRLAEKAISHIAQIAEERALGRK